MPKVDRLVIPLSKAEYLLNYSAAAGAGGDKRRFWRQVMGFDSAEALRQALLLHVAAASLQPDGEVTWGERYRATILLRDVSGTFW